MQCSAGQLTSTAYHCKHTAAGTRCAADLDAVATARTHHWQHHCCVCACVPACSPVLQNCAIAVAVGLGLRSIASVDGFVNADTGELIVRDVKHTPALTDGSPLLQQVGG